MIHRSPHGNVEIPETDLVSFVFSNAEKRRDKPALIDGATGRSLSYGELVALIRRAAAGLARRGFKKGDVLGLALPNALEYPVVFYAVSLLGGATTTINCMATSAEMALQLADAGAKLVVTCPALLDKVRDAAAQARIVDVLVDLPLEDGTPPEVVIDPREDIVALPYSSGTTGLPKGVMLTHFNLVANIVQFEVGFDALDENDTLVSVLPFFHIYGLSVILNAGLYRGSTIVTLPRFDLELFLTTLQNYKVTFAHVVPPIVLALARHPLVDRFDLSRLRAVFSGAAPLSEDLAKACGTRLACAVVQGYGMTEASPGTHSSPGDLVQSKPGSIGVLLPNTECKLVDPATGNAVGPGERGELWVRGPQVMKGYLGNPNATAETVDGEGWLRTGDVGYVDDDGHFYIVDRVKELIKYKGFQVAPAELEALLLTHPRVADAAVVPLPDEEAGEVPQAFVVPRDEVTAEEVMSFVTERVAPYKRIRRVTFVGEIPKSPSGKILRRVLAARSALG